MRIMLYMYNCRPAIYPISLPMCQLRAKNEYTHLGRETVSDGKGGGKIFLHHLVKS